MAFVEWAACIALLCLGVAFHSALVNLRLMALYASILLLGSCAILWRQIKRKPGDSHAPLGQAAGLLRRLRRRMLDGSDRRDG